VHRSSVIPEIPYKVMVIDVPEDDRIIKKIEINMLPGNWRTLSAYSILQNIGSDWYLSQETLLLRVPSAVIVQEYNYLINTEHPDYPLKVKLAHVEDYFWDERLL
jgi:RES domain-containing protein